uniref:Uncharacterized protein n=1 Tax=Solanum tuberosum TaxID=4113 RepID=M1DC19_SOLTU
MNNQGDPVNPIGGNLGDGVGLQPPRVGDENNQVQAENLLGDALRVYDPPGPRLRDNYKVNFNVVESEGPRDNYRVNFNTIEFEGPLVLTPIPPGHTFVRSTDPIDAPGFIPLTVNGIRRSQGDDPTPPAHIDEALGSPSQAATQAPSSS